MSLIPKETDFIKLLNDSSFERIELELRSPNFFDILGATRSELRHSNFLAWLLDPNGNHGLGKLFLLRLLRDVFSDSRVNNLNGLEADTLDFQSIEVRREWQNIDIMVLMPGIVMAIEVKVDSQEHSNQLKKYRKTIEDHFPDLKKAYVLLTTFQDSAKSDEDQMHYVEYSFEKISMILSQIMEVYKNRMSDKIYLYLEDYQKVLKRNIMQDDPLNELAIKLYKIHRSTLDFIFENKPDLQKEIQDILLKIVEKNGFILGSTSKAYVRFLTHDLKKITKYHNQSNGWLHRELFLFEINIYFTSKDIRIVFKSVISPGDLEERELYREVISKVEEASHPYGQKWLVHFISNRKILKEKFEESTEEEKYSELEKIVDSFLPTVSKVEQALLADPRINKY